MTIDTAKEREHLRDPDVDHLMTAHRYLDVIDAQAAEIERLRAEPQWQFVDSAPTDFTSIICGHAEKRWIRFGRYEPQTGRWYYSGTSERSQWSMIEGDEPTHWQALPAFPEREP